MRKNQIILIIVGIIILIGLIAGFYYWFQGEKSKVSEKEESETLKEISQEEAVEIALGEYPGEVYSVSKTETPPLLEGQDSTEKFWMVGINLDEPIEKELPAGSFATSAEIFISVDTGTVSVLRLR